jgi:hypothetical protein
VRVESLLDGTHQLQRHRLLALGQFVALQRADAVFDGNRTAQCAHRVID